MKIVNQDLINASHKHKIPLQILKHWYKIIDRDNWRELVQLIYETYYNMMISSTPQGTRFKEYKSYVEFLRKFFPIKDLHYND